MPHCVLSPSHPSTVLRAPCRFPALPRGLIMMRPTFLSRQVPVRAPTLRTSSSFAELHFSTGVVSPFHSQVRPPVPPPLARCFTAAEVRNFTARSWPPPSPPSQRLPVHVRSAWLPPSPRASPRHRVSLYNCGRGRPRRTHVYRPASSAFDTESTFTAAANPAAAHHQGGRLRRSRHALACAACVRVASRRRVPTSPPAGRFFGLLVARRVQRRSGGKARAHRSACCPARHRRGAACAALAALWPLPLARARCLQPPCAHLTTCRPFPWAAGRSASAEAFGP